MGGTSKHQAARAEVATYHESMLADLVGRVAEAVDRFRAGDLDAFEMDVVIFQYSRAAKELWKFCNLGNVETAATIIRDEPSINWWELGAPRKR